MLENVRLYLIKFITYLNGHLPAFCLGLILGYVFAEFVLIGYSVLLELKLIELGFPLSNLNLLEVSK